jgi:hypothetical protein
MFEPVLVVLAIIAWLPHLYSSHQFLNAIISASADNSAHFIRHSFIIPILDSLLRARFSPLI